jgi:hypothetical protein
MQALSRTLKSRINYSIKWIASSSTNLSARRSGAISIWQHEKEKTMKSTNRTDDGLDIPEILKISAERRMQAWIEYDQRQRTPEAVIRREQQLEDIAA